MTSPFRIDANRRNAQLSTGPRAPQGKAAAMASPPATPSPGAQIPPISSADRPSAPAFRSPPVAE